MALALSIVFCQKWQKFITANKRWFRNLSKTQIFYLALSVLAPNKIQSLLLLAHSNFVRGVRTLTGPAEQIFKWGG